MKNGSKNTIFIPVIVAVITGIFAGIPALLNFINTPRTIEAKFGKIRLQSEEQLKLQREQEVARILVRLDDPDVHVRAGAALALSMLGGKQVVPILVGKLRESATKLALLELTTKETVNTESIQQERLFINALKQSLLTIGLPSLEQLIELNRELRSSPKQAAAFAARWKEGNLARLLCLKCIRYQ